MLLERLAVRERVFKTCNLVLFWDLLMAVLRIQEEAMFIRVHWANWVDSEVYMEFGVWAACEHLDISLKI